jgi:hypothetical protein
MRNIIVITYIFILLQAIGGCDLADKSKEIAKYKYDDTSGIMTVKVDKSIGSWVKKGVECYGLIMVCDLEGNPLRIKEVHVRVLEMNSNKIKMQAMEDVMANKTIECKKISFRKGQSWEEEYGEIFRTREEAIKYIDKQYPGLRVTH